MWIMLALAFVIIALIIMLVGPASLRRNREDSYEYYKRNYSAYRKDKKYYKVFNRRKQDEKN